MLSQVSLQSVGRTNVVTEPLSLGQRLELADLDYASAEGVKKQLSGLVITAVLLKNDSGGALLPGEGGVFKAGSAGQFAGAKWGADAHPHFIVDPFLPAAGVANGETFLGFIAGPVTVIHAGGDTIVAGDALETGAAGRIDKYATGAGKTDARVGVAMATPANNNAGTKFRALVDLRI